MKKLTLTIVTALAMAGAAFAQGTISWSATLTSTAITGQINNNGSALFGGSGGGTGTSTATTANGYYYELLYNTTFTGGLIAAPGLGVLTGSWIDTGFVANNSTATAGRIVAAGQSTAKVPLGTWAGGIGTQGGKTNNIVLVGWSSNLGTSWSAVETVLANWSTDGTIQGAYFGISNTGFIVPNIAPAVGANPFTTVATLNGTPINSLNMQLYLLPVPEPSTLALAGLGGLSLLLFRRRK